MFQPDGVMNYHHTPYLIDLIRFASIQVPDFDIPVPEQFVVPEVRDHLYVPGSPVARPSLFGELEDVLCLSSVDFYFHSLKASVGA